MYGTNLTNGNLEESRYIKFFILLLSSQENLKSSRMLVEVNRKDMEFDVAHGYTGQLIDQNSKAVEND